jgi:hypothetical protein
MAGRWRIGRGYRHDGVCFAMTGSSCRSG